MERRVPLKRGDGLERRTPLKPKTEGMVNRRKPLRQGRGFAASRAQREKVKDCVCLVCGRDEVWDGVKIDPAHLTPRSKGGCDDRLCVAPLCRTCHRAYDDGELDLLPHLTYEPTGLLYLPELQHMLVHLSPVEMVEQLANARVEWRTE